MDKNAEKLIAQLSPEIDEKCDELKTLKKEKKLTKIFVFLCIMAVILPTVFVFAGIALTIIFIPIIFIAVVFLLLSPVIINQKNQGEKANGTT